MLEERASQCLVHSKPEALHALPTPQPPICPGKAVIFIGISALQNKEIEAQTVSLKLPEATQLVCDNIGIPSRFAGTQSPCP